MHIMSRPDLTLHIFKHFMNEKVIEKIVLVLAIPSLYYKLEGFDLKP